MIKELNNHVISELKRVKKAQYDATELNDIIYYGGMKTALNQVKNVNQKANKTKNQLSIWVMGRLEAKQKHLSETDVINNEHNSIRGQIRVFKSLLEFIDVSIPTYVQKAVKSAKNGVREFNTLEVYPIEHFYDVCDAINRISDRKKQWLKMISVGGDKLVCPITKLEATRVHLDIQYYKRGSHSFHWNFYTECGRMFTVDHIVPKSKGGALNDVDNLQAMIREYNELKSNRDISYEELKKEVYGETV